MWGGWVQGSGVEVGDGFGQGIEEGNGGGVVWMRVGGVDSEVLLKASNRCFR